MGDLGKLIAAKGFKKWPKVQKIAQSGHTAQNAPLVCLTYSVSHILEKQPKLGTKKKISTVDIITDGNEFTVKTCERNELLVVGINYQR